MSCFYDTEFGTERTKPALPPIDLDEERRVPECPHYRYKQLPCRRSLRMMPDVHQTFARRVHCLGQITHVALEIALVLQQLGHL